MSDIFLVGGVEGWVGFRSIIGGVRISDLYFGYFFQITTGAVSVPDSDIDVDVDVDVDINAVVVDFSRWFLLHGHLSIQVHPDATDQSIERVHLGKIRRDNPDRLRLGLFPLQDLQNGLDELDDELGFLYIGPGSAAAAKRVESA